MNWLACLLYSLVVLSVTAQHASEEEEKEWPPYDGWYNNRAHPEWGVVESALERLLESHYKDGTYAPSGSDRPNPRLVSNSTMAGLTGLPSYMNRTALLVFFGQQVVEEVLDAQRAGCPPEYFNIPIPKGDLLYDPEEKGNIEIPFLRSRYVQSITGYNPNNPRQQMNEITPYIDGGLTYGVSKAWADGLRLLKTDCPERDRNSENYTPYLFPARADRNESVTDCRGELASYKNEGNFPIENSLGLPLANPPPPRDHPELKPVYRFFRLGNPRGNENPFLLTFGVLWFRHHNWLAREVRREYPDWSDERVFNEARIRNIAVHQHIIMYEWLPALLGDCDVLNSMNRRCQYVPPYSGYNPSVHPGISHAFQSAAMRWGHTIVPPGVFRRTGYNNGAGRSCEFINTTIQTAGTRHEFIDTHVGRKGLRTCNTYWNSIEAVQESDIDQLLMGMASQICEREDNIITPDLRGSVFGFLEFNRRDLMAINIQRGRDHGLPDYQTARRNMGLETLTSFEQINPALFSSETIFETAPPDIQTANGTSILANLRRVHNDSMDKIDVWTGGLLETTQSGPGELFRAIILDQFIRIRDGDRFWYENEANRLFTREQLYFIRNTTIRDVILRTNPSMHEDDIQNNPFRWLSNDTRAFCPQPYQLSETNMENCTAPETYDYFTGSEVAFALTFLSVGLFAIVVILFLLILGRQAENKKAQIRKRAAALTKQRSHVGNADDFDIAFEVLGVRNKREIKIKFEQGGKIQIYGVRGSRPLRTIDLRKSNDVVIMRSYSKGRDLMFVRANTESHDLVLRFNDCEERDSHLVRLRTFLQTSSVAYVENEVSQAQILEQANTKEMRDALLQKFFKTALAASVNLESVNDDGITEYATSREAKKFIHVELSKEEFAEYMKLKPNSLFVEQMFTIADVDGNGVISFREFLDIMVLFTKGSPRDKAKLMFEMYDLDKSGELSVSEFRTMLKSMMEMVNASVAVEQLDDVVNTVMSSHGFGNKSSLTLDDFQKIMSNYNQELSDASLHNPAGFKREEHKTMMHSATPKESKGIRARRTVKEYANSSKRKDGEIRSRPERQSKVFINVEQSNFVRSPFWQKVYAFENYIQNYRLEIFWLSLYIVVTAAIFAERVYFFSVEREWAGLRRICGYGVSVTRGAASGMMFTYSSLLVTMCRNVITALRETALHRYIPFDSAVTMHRIIAWIALVISGVHIIGHSLNFYSISTQPPGDVTCLFRDYFRPSHVLPTFQYWCWQTITGFTGVLCTLVAIVMYTFASDYSRQRVFQWFWWTHKLGFVSLYLFMILHGSGFLVQRPFFYYFFLGPVVLYTLDKLYSLSRNKAEISVVNAELLPSEVTYLEFKRPTNFDYKAGQWVRISCLAQSPGEYHPFTLTSAPSEDTLKLHIRAVGPWTINLRNIYNPDVLRDSPYPKLYLDGPFGEGHQDWYKFEVSVLVGGGIGVTPFASILKDLISVSQSGVKIACKKVYFMWITRDQKQYEWLTDIIQEVEEKDNKNLLDTHIFITQFPQKFDLRTTMLYICERHFQKVAGKSLFTGLRAVTHFGRPDFRSFFASLAEEHAKIDKFGVFSCGPPPMTNGVDKTCSQMNKYEGASFIHHFENF